MNVDKLNVRQLHKLKKVVKATFKENKIYDRQVGDEKVYSGKEIGGRGLKSMNDACLGNKVQVA